MTESICLTVYFDGSFWLGRLEWREHQARQFALKQAKRREKHRGH